MTETRTKQPYTAARKRANEKWNAANTKAMRFVFMLKGDADILEKLNSVPNKTDYIRRLIREDIAREQQK